MWLSWLKRLSSKQEMVSLKLTAALYLAAIRYSAAKTNATCSFELTISYLLERRFNQLSYAALFQIMKNLHYSNKSASQQKD